MLIVCKVISRESEIVNLSRLFIDVYCAYERSETTNLVLKLVKN